MLAPLGGGRFLNLVVLCGYQGADTDAEQLALTEQLFDAAFAELGVVAWGSPCLLAGDFNVEATKIPLPGLWVVTCKRGWVSTGGSRRDFLVGRLLTAAAVLSCSVCAGRWLQPHFAIAAPFDCER